MNGSMFTRSGSMFTSSLNNQTAADSRSTSDEGIEIATTSSSFFTGQSSANQARKSASSDASANGEQQASFGNTAGKDASRDAEHTETATPNPFAQRSLENQPSTTIASDASVTASNLSTPMPVPEQEKQQSSSAGLFGQFLSKTPKVVSSSSPAVLTGTSAPTVEAPDKPAVPKIGKVTVPPNWVVTNAESNDINVLATELAKVNENYRMKLAQLPATADWSSLSRWHSRETSALNKKIHSIKKQLAAAKGITGEESSLSTKRKTVEAAEHEYQHESPTKKARSDAVPTTPASKASVLFSTTPKATPPSNTSGLFGSALTKQNNFASDDTAVSQAKAAGFTKSVLAKETPSQTGFKPVFAVSSTPDVSGFKPSTGVSAPGNSVGLFSQFGSQARSDRKKKAEDEDWDPDEETKEEWSARWDAEQAQREAEQAAQSAAQSKTAAGFTFKSSTTGESSAPIFRFSTVSSETTSTNNGNAGSHDLTSGISTPGLFGSRVGSPALSAAGARSVLDTPSAAQSPSSNMFSHLASGPSSQNQDDTDDEAAESSDGEGSKKRNHEDTVDAESESSETLEDSMRRKKSGLGTLASRITRDDSVAAQESSEKEVTKPDLNSSFFQQNSGSQTPKDKTPFKFFDFSAAAQSAPPKPSAFAGDQTFKPGSPIKFGTATKSNTTFSVTPASPSPAEPSTTTSKAASSPFSFLNAPKVASASSSALTSRAATPASDIEASGGESVVDGDEAAPHVEQHDFSLLTAEERDEYEILFEAEQAVAKKVVKSKWEQVANGRLWVLKNKTSGQVLVRLRMKNGRLPINHQIPSGIESKIGGKNKTMVTAPLPSDAKLESGVFGFKATQPCSNDEEKMAMAQELAQTFSSVYNSNV